MLEVLCFQGLEGSRDVDESRNPVGLAGDGSLYLKELRPVNGSAGLVLAWEQVIIYCST